jgi:hypothetical protein
MGVYPASASANRRNAKKINGPKTEKGKTVSNLNAVQMDIPTLVLIRNPEDAMASAVLREPDIPISAFLDRYLVFYQTLEPYRTGFVPADFSEVVSDFGGVIRRINAKYGTSFRDFDHSEGNVEAVYTRWPLSLPSANGLAGGHVPWYRVEITIALQSLSLGVTIWVVSRRLVMKKDRSQGAILMVIGVAVLNFIYLWDMIVGKHDGFIFLGLWSWVIIVVANVVIVASLTKMVGREEHAGRDGGGDQTD